MDAATKISDAIGSIEDLLQLKSQRDYSVGLLREDEITEELFGGMLDPKTRTFYFSQNSKEHMFYHEAAHWVLINNDILLRDKSIFPIFGWAIDEVLAELCANTLDEKIGEHVSTDQDEIRRRALATMTQKEEFLLAAGMYILENGRDDPKALATAAHLLSIPDIAYFSLQIMELEKVYHERRHMMADEYQEFQEKWKKRGNAAVERGVAGMIGERVGAMLYEKGYRPKKILDEIMDASFHSPMQMYWNIIAPKLTTPKMI